VPEQRTPPADRIGLSRDAGFFRAGDLARAVLKEADTFWT
jgi:hypothetical protein